MSSPGHPSSETDEKIPGAAPQDSTNDPLTPKLSDGSSSFPEGGPTAWAVVVGSWLALFGSMGLMNSIGAFQAYISRNQLQAYGSADVGWIFGVYCGLAFFCGIQVGPIFDAQGPRVLILIGGLGTVLYLVLLGFCTEYWHFMLTFGVLGGISLSLTFVPAISIVAHYFNRRRGLATGIASSGSSLGGIIFPIALQRLYDQVGFAWATRIAALICLVTFSCALALIRRRLPAKPLSLRRVLPDPSVFLEPGLTLTSLGVFFMEWGLFVPLSYLPSYALDQNLPSELSYVLLALVNAGAAPGRWIPGYLSDRMGRFNVLIITILGCTVCTAALWITAGSNQSTLIAFAVLFGVFSGGNVSLAPVCIGQLCKVENYGRYYATANSLVSISTLTSIPISGEIYRQSGGDYRNLILFVIFSYVASFVCLVMAKIACCGLKGIWAVF